MAEQGDSFRSRSIAAFGRWGPINYRINAIFLDYRARQIIAHKVPD
jgi:hypothetical protein